MPGLCSPEEAAAAVAAIQGEADACGRTMDAEHFGMNLSWVDGAISDRVRAGIEARRPGFDPAHTIGVGASGLAERIHAFLDAGLSKFVIRPAEASDATALQPPAADDAAGATSSLPASEPTDWPTPAPM